MTFTTKQQVLAITVGAALTLLSPLATAQKISLEEVIVTAQKREESMQDVPIAITAITAESLGASGISDSNDLPILTPSLQYYRAVGSASPFIRGIGSLSTGVGGEGSIATYIDGVYIREMYGVSQNFNNVERVEVLNGPQGTLFGRNSTGGLIQTITKTPTQETEAVLSASLGNFDDISADFYGATGITDNIAADIAIAVRSQGEGYGRNLTTGSDIGYHEYTQLRSKWVIEVSDITSLTLALQWSDKEDDFGQNRTCAPNSSCIFSTPATTNFEDTFANTPSFNESEGWLSSVRFEHSFDGFDFVSLTSYQGHESFGQTDVEGSPFTVADFRLRQFSETFSQELQLQSTGDDALQWIAGVFFWDDEAEWNPAATDPVTPTLTVPAGTIDIYGVVETTSYAAFGQVYLDLTDNTRLTLGGRWTYDERTFNGRNTFNVGGPAFDVAFSGPGGTAEYEEPSWRIALDHHISDSVMVYTAYNRSFKSGQFSTVVTNGVAKPPLETEVLDSFTVGMKGEFLDSRLRLNAEAFHYKIDNLQMRSQATDGSVDIFNAASGEMNGLELQATGLLSDSLSAMISIAVLDSEYVDFPNCPIHTNSPLANGGLGGNFVDTTGNCTGNTMLNAPEISYSVVLNHYLPTDIGTFNSSLTYYYNDGFFVGPDEGFAQPSYGVVNASTHWISGNDKLEIGVYGNNLTEEHYSTGYDVQETGNIVPVAMFPREFGVRFKYNLL